MKTKLLPVAFAATALGFVLSLSATAFASTLSGSVILPTDNFRIDGAGSSIGFYSGNHCISCGGLTYMGSLSISGTMTVSGSVAFPTNNFGLSASGNTINMYSGSATNFIGSLSVSGGTVSGIVNCDTNGFRVDGVGNQMVITCDSGPGGAITFTDNPPPPPPPSVTAVCGTVDPYSCTAGTDDLSSNVNGATTWTWTCKGSGGGADASCSKAKPANFVPGTVTITVAPGLDFYIDPLATPRTTTATVQSGGFKTLSWSTTNVTSCTATGPWTGAISILTSYSSWNTGSLTTTTTYAISCSGPGGSVGPKTVTVTVTIPPSINLYLSSP